MLQIRKIYYAYLLKVRNSTKQGSVLVSANHSQESFPQVLKKKKVA